jgi:hypothetical protein
VEKKFDSGVEYFVHEGCDGRSHGLAKTGETRSVQGDCALCGKPLDPAPNSTFVAKVVIDEDGYLVDPE